MISIYTPTWNESHILGYYYRFYKERFPSCNFNLYDNESKDATLPIALSLGMNVLSWGSNNTYDEISLMKIRYNCWRDNKGFVLVCDADEWIDINEDQLRDEIESGTTVIRTIGYDMCNVDNQVDLFNIKHGVRNNRFDKLLMFDSSKVDSMNWIPGCHDANPTGEVVYSKKQYNLYHMKYWNLGYMQYRYKLLNERRSENSIANDFGIQYSWEAQQIESDYRNMINKAEII